MMLLPQLVLERKESRHGWVQLLGSGLGLLLCLELGFEADVSNWVACNSRHERCHCWITPCSGIGLLLDLLPLVHYTWPLGLGCPLGFQLCLGLGDGRVVF